MVGKNEQLREQLNCFDSEFKGSSRRYIMIRNAAQRDAWGLGTEFLILDLNQFYQCLCTLRSAPASQSGGGPPQKKRKR